MGIQGRRVAAVGSPKKGGGLFYSLPGSGAQYGLTEWAIYMFPHPLRGVGRQAKPGLLDGGQGGFRAKEFTLAAVAVSSRLQRDDPKALALGHER